VPVGCSLAGSGNRHGENYDENSADWLCSRLIAGRSHDSHGSKWSAHWGIRLRLPSSPPRLLPLLKGALRPPQRAAFFFFGGWIIAPPTSDGSIILAVSRYLRQSVSPRPAPIILPPICAPAHPRNRHRRVFARRCPLRQSRRPIPRQTRAAGSGVPYLLARRRRSCPSHVALFGPIRLIFVITIIAGGVVHEAST
jgi:hypothetical protein